MLTQVRHCDKLTHPAGFAVRSYAAATICRISKEDSDAKCVNLTHDKAIGMW
jgi:hypothetical protein